MSPCPAFHLRRFETTDTRACTDIYFDAVRNGTATHYSARQAAAWAPENAALPDWAPRLAAGLTWLGIAAKAPSGLITLANSGHLDFFFVRPAWQRKGLAEALYRKLIADAHDMGCAVLTTHASHLARRFLERRGWHVTDTQNVERNGVRIPRFAMALPALDQGVNAT